MEHERTIFYFSNGYRVEYYYIIDLEYESKQLKATVYQNDEVIADFNRIPHTRTVNPTKTQAKELISHANKLKNRPNQKKSSKILNQS